MSVQTSCNIPGISCRRFQLQWRFRTAWRERQEAFGEQVASSANIDTELPKVCFKALLLSSNEEEPFDMTTFLSHAFEPEQIIDDALAIVLRFGYPFAFNRDLDDVSIAGAQDVVDLPRVCSHLTTNHGEALNQSSVAAMAIPAA
jgi:hypothetical protein